MNVINEFKGVENVEVNVCGKKVNIDIVHPDQTYAFSALLTSDTVMGVMNRLEGIMRHDNEIKVTLSFMTTEGPVCYDTVSNADEAHNAWRNVIGYEKSQRKWFCGEGFNWLAYGVKIVVEKNGSIVESKVDYTEQYYMPVYLNGYCIMKNGFVKNFTM